MGAEREVAIGSRIVGSLAHNPGVFYLEVKVLNRNRTAYYWYPIAVHASKRETELQHAQLVMGTHEKYVLKPK